MPSSRKKAPPETRTKRLEGQPHGGALKRERLITELSKQEFGDIFGISAKQLERFFDDGMPNYKEGSRVMLPMPAARVWYHKHLIDKGRREAQPSTLDEEKQRKLAAERAMAEIELADRCAQLMSVDDHTKLLADAYGRVKAQLLNLDSSIAQELAPTAAEIAAYQSRIRPLILTVIDELRNAPKQAVPDESTEDVS